MRVTIIPADGFCAVDGYGLLNVDMTGVAANVHAVQFDGGHGTIEKKDRTHETIDSVSQFQDVIDRHAAMKAEIEARAADPFYGMTTQQAAAAAVAMKVNELDRHHDQIKYANFTWQGHSYYVDNDAVDDVEGTKDRCSRMAMTDPIPTPCPITGNWVSADVDPETGMRVQVPMTVEDLHDFSDALYDHRAALWMARGIHELTIKGMAAGGATAAQILAYDVTTGWS